MGAFGRYTEDACQTCRSTDGTVRRRGRCVPLGMLCQRCWNLLTNDLEAQDGARWLPPDDPDSYLPYAYPRCGDCGAELTWYPTNYERWVALEAAEQPAKDVPPAFQWRVYTDLRTGVTAVRILQPPEPSDPVRPAHRAVCPARLADHATTDLGRLYRHRRDHLGPEV